MDAHFSQTARVLKIALFAAIITIPIHAFLVQPFVVPDNALSPEYKKGDVILVNRLAWLGSPFGREEVVVFRNRSTRGDRHIRRIRGLPLERVTVNDGILAIQGEAEAVFELPLFGSVVSSLADKGRLDENEYFIVSDNGITEVDGIVDERFILGKPLLKIWSR